MKAMLLQVCCCSGGLCSTLEAQFLSVTAGRGEETTSRAKPPKANPTGFCARHSVTPQMCSPGTRGLALALGIPDKVGQMFLQPRMRSSRLLKTGIQFHPGQAGSS